MKAMGQRQHRVAEKVRHIVAKALVQREWVAPMDTTLLVVDDVWMSADLKIARVFISGLTTPLDAASVKELNQHAAPLRKHLGRELGTKYTPELELWKS